MSTLPILKIIMKSMFGKSSTIKYPLEIKQPYESARGHIDIEIEKCIFCGICQKRCPTRAIIVNKAEKNWSIARCDCIQCNSCADNCPKKCLIMETKQPEATYEQKRHLVSLSENKETVGQDA